MAWVYILKGSKGRYYIGATEDLAARVARHHSGMAHSTKRLGLHDAIFLQAKGDKEPWKANYTK